MSKRVILEKIERMPSGNRDLKSSLVRKLKDSITKYGILRSVVVIHTNIFGGKKKYYIADGQHLYQACEALNLEDELTYIVVQRKFETITEVVNFVATLNTSQSPWKLPDFIGAYASTNQYLSYNKIVQKRIHFDLSYSMLAIIYSGLSKSVAAKAIKSGNFRIGDSENGEVRSDEMAALVLELSGKEYFGRTNSTDLTVMAYVLYKWYKSNSYSSVDLLNYIGDHLQDFVGATDSEMLESLNKFSKLSNVRYPKFAQ